MTTLALNGNKEKINNRILKEVVVKNRTAR